MKPPCCPAILNTVTGQEILWGQPLFIRGKVFFLGHSNLTLAGIMLVFFVCFFFFRCSPAVEASFKIKIWWIIPIVFSSEKGKRHHYSSINCSTTQLSLSSDKCFTHSLTHLKLLSPSSTTFSSINKCGNILTVEVTTEMNYSRTTARVVCPTATTIARIFHLNWAAYENNSTDEVCYLLTSSG